jgi:hypothetical protein
MPSWFVIETFRCRSCEYDVTQTLRDGFGICPECGGDISFETCDRDLSAISPEARRLIYLSWALPLAAAVAGAMVQSPAVFWLLMLPALAAIYAGWWYVERFTAGPGAWYRAILPALAVLVLYGIVLVPIIALLFAMF